MPSLKEYFLNDFHELSLDYSLKMTINGIGIESEELEIKQRVIHDSNSSVRFFTFYIPHTNEPLGVLCEILSQLPEQINKSNGIEIIGGFMKDTQAGTHHNQYSNRVYFYTERDLKEEDLDILDTHSRNLNLFVTVRSKDYLKNKMELNSPVAFISHDSRDKDLIARPLAQGLSSRLCSVWYDEYSLRIGDSLRESIEKGIKEVQHCILILTKNYLTNPGWGKTEFDSIFTREIMLNERIVLPIWFDVDKKDVYEYSPSLANTYALIWPSPKDKNENDYKKEVEQLISKIHTRLINK